MKTLRMFGMALLAILMCVNFTSCSNEDDLEIQEPQKCTISLGCTGEILDITNKPLSRNGEEELGLYTIQVVSNNKTCAKGTFKSLDGLTVDLFLGETYMFLVTYEPDNTSDATNSFDYTLKDYSNTSVHQYFVKGDSYFGELSEYTATANGVAEIYMKRMSFGLNVSVIDLPEDASVTVKLDPYYVSLSPSFMTICELTKTDDEYDEIHILDKGDYRNVYRGTWGNADGYLNFYMTPRLQVLLKRTDGKEVVLAEEDIKVERNKKTYIKINIGNSADITSGEFDITFEEGEFEDGNEYDVNGDEGTIVETPITTA